MCSSFSRTGILLIVLALAAGQIPRSTHAFQDTSAVVNVEIIVDASGSMAGETDTGELRMDAAQRVLNEVIKAIPTADGINVGLRVYGHEGDNTDAGKAESCAASDLVVPIDGVATDELLAQVNAFEPTGWTPLGMSLEEASVDLEAVASNDSTNAIILLTDGIETCEGDPVRAATRAFESDANIVTNVIGFATEPEDEVNLNDIAVAGGGQLLNANNAGQLISALFEVLEELEVVDEGGNGESREAAIGVGRAGQVGDYDVTVVSVTSNATDIVMAENQFNEPPEEGEQFFLARIAVTYNGSESGVPASELNFQAVGDSNVGYATYSDTCGVIPDDSYLVTDLFEGGSAEFNVCWSVTSEDADSLVMYVESFLDFDSKPVWFSLGNSVTGPDESTPTDDDVADTLTRLKGGQPSTAQAATPASDRATEPPDETPDPELDADGTDRDSPVAVGETAPVGDYEVTVISVTPDATDVVLAENQFNEPPAPGKQFFMARVSVTYNGSESGFPAAELNFQAVGDSNAGYATYTDTCGVIPEDSIFITDLFEGGTAEFNVCWAIDSEDADSLVMYVESFLDFDSEPVWFSLEDESVWNCMRTMMTC